MSVGSAAKTLNLPDEVVEEAMDRAEDTNQKLDNTPKIGNQVQREIKQEKAIQQVETLKPNDRFEVHNLSCREMIGVVPAGSVDVILTDPPYPMAFIEAWTELKELAIHALKPGGRLIALSGGINLMEVARRLDCPELRFRYPISFNKGKFDSEGYWTPKHTDIGSAHIYEIGRPVLVFHRSPDNFTEATYIPTSLFYEEEVGYKAVVEEEYEWAQSLNGFATFFTPPVSRPSAYHTRRLYRP